MRLENSELRALRAVIEQGGFKRAADALHISQSAVSQAVAGLEGKLGTALIHRGKELKLTDAGKRLFDHAVEVLREEQRTLEEIAQLKLGHRDTLSLALSASINYFYGDMLVSAYYLKNPRTRLKISDMPSRSMIYAVLSGGIDIGFGPFQKHMQAFDTVPLYSDSRHLVISPNHPRYEAIIGGDESALLQTPLIASALDSPELRPSIQRLRDRFNMVWEIGSMRLRIHMVERGMGVTFLDRKLLQEHPRCGKFEVVEHVSFGSIDRQVGLYFRSGKSLSQSTENFIELCKTIWRREDEADTPEFTEEVTAWQ